MTTSGALGGMPAQPAEPVYEIAQVQRPTPLYASPGGAVVARVGTRTEFGSPQTLGVLRHRGRWLAIVSTLRPNGQVSWVREGAVKLTRTDISLVLDRSRRLRGRRYRHRGRRMTEAPLEQRLAPRRDAERQERDSRRNELYRVPTRRTCAGPASAGSSPPS